MLICIRLSKKMLKQTFLHDFYKSMSSNPSPKRPVTPLGPKQRKKVKLTPPKEPSVELSQSMDNDDNLTLPCALATKIQENIHAARQLLENNQTIEFNLESIYAEKKFNFTLDTSRINDKNLIKTVHPPTNKHALRLYELMIEVFKNPMNCVYFDKSELDMILSIVTLPGKCLTVLARIVKWKPGWHRVTKAAASMEVNSQDISSAKELYESQICDNDIVHEDLQVALNLLTLEDIKAVAKIMRVSLRTGTSKTKLIEKLMEISSKQKSLFPGATSPGEAVRRQVDYTLGACIKVSDSMWSLLRKIIALHIPNQNYDETIPDTFHMLMDVHYNKKIYPEMPIERFPLFENRQDFAQYMKSRQILTDVVLAVEKKDWQTIRNLGRHAHRELVNLLTFKDVEHDSSLPEHIKRFSAPYLLSKVMWKSVDAFKKSDDTVDEAKEILKTLIEHKNVLSRHCGNWYEELALIEMKQKNLDESAKLTEEALKENLSPVEVAMMLERARKLAGRKCGISSESKDTMIQLIEEKTREFTCTPKEHVIIGQKKMNHEMSTRGKSTWKLDDISYGDVESLAMMHYCQQETGFTNALHCESRLPNTLFACLLWNEIYTVPVPGAFISNYQIAPLDLWTAGFYDNRKEQIDHRIDFARNIDIESLSEIMHSNYLDFCEYTSLIHTNMFEDNDSLKLKEIIQCLGTEGVVGICQTLITNYRQMSAGFPDLIVWNSKKLTCKIVEVKGPGDSLSVKQKMWIKRLEELHVDVEVCLIKN